MHINIKNRVHNHSGDLIKSQQIETKNILIDERHFKNLVTYFTRYVNCKSMNGNKLMGKIEEYEGKII